jgi:hypothetical protein
MQEHHWFYFSIFLALLLVLNQLTKQLDIMRAHKLKQLKKMRKQATLAE